MVPQTWLSVACIKPTNLIVVPQTWLAESKHPMNQWNLINHFHAPDCSRPIVSIQAFQDPNQRRCLLMPATRHLISRSHILRVIILQETNPMKPNCIHQIHSQPPKRRPVHHIPILEELILLDDHLITELAIDRGALSHVYRLSNTWLLWEGGLIVGVPSPDKWVDDLSESFLIEGPFK